MRRFDLAEHLVERVGEQPDFIAAFFDGGWFGPNGSGPGATGTLDAGHLIEPIIQITLDGGGTWTAVPHTSNYTTALSGVVLPVAFGPPTLATATFNLSTLQTGITGIRVIGSEGGTASGGFLGLADIGVNAEAVPEPATFGLFAATGAFLLRRRRLSR